MVAGQADIGAALSWAFKKFQEHIATFLSLAGVIMAVQVVGGIISWQLATNAGELEFDPNTGRFTDTSSFWSGLIGALVISIVVGVLVWILRIGLLRAALRTTSGETPAMSDLTSGSNLGAYIVTAIAVGLATFVGFLLCVIPGLIAAFFMAFAPTHSLAKGAGVGDSFRWSINAVKANIVPVLVLVLLTIAAGLVGAFLRGVAGIVLVGIFGLFLEPIAALLNANLYRQFGNEPIAP